LRHRSQTQPRIVQITVLERLMDFAPYSSARLGTNRTSNFLFAHIATVLGAIAASLGATTHLLVFTYGLAILGTGIADLCASGADRGMLRRTSEKGVGGRLANLGAIEQ